MKIEQIYTGCLSQAAYLIQSEGEAAIIDPLRDIDSYLEKFESDGLKLKYIFETHFHADFVSGHLDLHRKTGAPIVYGPNAEPNFEFLSGADNQIFEVGKVKIQLLHTPGHTPESSCFLIYDEDGNPNSIFTGDTLFLGDVGRPDLAVSSATTSEDLAKMLYSSLYEKIMPLADELLVYPGHGAGSACGKNLSKDTVGKLGDQKQNNYALQAKNSGEFVKLVLNGQTTPPAYFPENAKLNKMGYAPFEQVLSEGSKALSPDEFEAVANQTHALILDTRGADLFAKGFVPRSINIGLGGQFASWMGTLNANLSQPILLISAPGTEEEAITRLARVGFSHIIGYLHNGFNAWSEAGKEVDSISTLTADEFASTNWDSDVVVDVRGEKEYLSEHLDYEQVVNLPLDQINQTFAKLPKDKHLYIHCAGGYRSMIAASILKARGFHQITDVRGGFGAIKNTQLNATAYVCPSTL